jgi:uncharacterized protein (DUF58 family)
MPTRDAYAVAALALLIFLVAFNLQSGWVYAIDALLIGVLIAGFLSAHHAVHSVSLTRTLPAEAVDGEPVAVGLTLRAAGFGRRILIQAVDAVPGLRPGDVFIPAVVPSQPRHASYRSTAIRRGIHRVETARVCSAGLTGLFLARREVPAPGEITVYPKYWKISRFPLAAWMPAFQTVGSTRRRGGLEFYGLRDYRSGDSVRHVHWRSSARRGTLMVREFEQDIPGAAALLIDTRPEVQAGGAVENTFEDLVRAAASILWYVTSRGGQVRLLASSPRGPLDLTGGWTALLRALAGLRAEGLVDPAALLLAVPLGRAPSIIVLSPDVRALGEVAASAVSAAGVMADPASYAKDIVGGPSRIDAQGMPVCVLRRGDDIGARLEGRPR